MAGERKVAAEMGRAEIHDATVDQQLLVVPGDFAESESYGASVVGAFAPESEVAEMLREAERATDGIAIGSYPFFKEGRVGSNFVVRSEDEGLAQAVADELAAKLAETGYPAVMGGI